MLPNWITKEEHNILNEFSFIITSSVCLWSFWMIFWWLANSGIWSSWWTHGGFSDIWDIIGFILFITWCVLSLMWLWIKFYWIEEKKWIQPIIKIWISTIIGLIIAILAHEYKIWILLFGILFGTIFFMFFWKRWLQNIVVCIVLILGTFGITLITLFFWYIILPVIGILVYIHNRKNKK